MIGERLERLRKDQKLKQKDMAKILGIDSSSYSKIESGKLSLTVKHLFKLAETFNISLDWLLMGKGEASPDCPDYGKFTESVKEMLSDMQNPGYLHNILSHYHQLKNDERIQEIVNSEGKRKQGT